MGVDRSSLRFLLSARARGVSFERTLTFGHQDLNLTPTDQRAEFEAAGVPSDPVSDSAALFARLGADSLDVMDASDYEGSVIRHDLNDPVPDGLRERFSAVVDGGTLEHVFNVGQGLKNAMEMVRSGGHLITLSPANNLMGHGFYQFSPDLFFRALSAENGFRIERVVLAEWGGGWFEAVDPASVGSRVELVNDRHVFIMTQAQRVEVKPVFETWPHQSDYTTRWNDGAGAYIEGRSLMEHGLRQRLKSVGPLWRLLRRLKWAVREVGADRRRSFDNAAHYRPVDR